MNGEQLDPLVAQYFQEIENSVGLPSKTEIVLAQRIQSGDAHALGLLVKANLRFVVKIAKDYREKGLPFSDVVSAGNLGLIIAAKRFDGTKGFKFTSYAVWWIRQSILLALAEQPRIVRLPLNKIHELSQFNRVVSTLEQKLGCAPVLSAVAEEMVVKIEDLNTLLIRAKSPKSLDQPCDNEVSKACLIDRIIDDSAVTDVGLLQAELREQIVGAMSTLTEREAEVISRHYGLNGYEPMTLHEIGITFGRSRERIRQIKEKALKVLRRSFKRAGVSDSDKDI